MELAIITFLTLSGLAIQISDSRSDIVDELNHAVNQAANKVSKYLNGEPGGDIRYLQGDRTLYLPYVNDNFGVYFKISHGDVKGLSSIQGANGNYLFETENGRLSMTVNLKFNKLEFKYDYEVENNVDFDPEMGILKFIAYKVPMKCAISLGLDFVTNQVVFYNLMIFDVLDSYQTEFHVNGKNYNNKEFNINDLVGLYSRYITAYAEQLIVEYSDVLREEIERQLRNKYAFTNAVQSFYNGFNY